MGDMREVFDYYKEYCKEQHRKRVAKTPDRIAYAAKMLEQRGIKYELKKSKYRALSLLAKIGQPAHTVLGRHRKNNGLSKRPWVKSPIINL